MFNYLLIVLLYFCVLANSKFIVPKEATDSLEIFQYRTDDEFIINNYAVTWNQANYICNYMLNGTLAYFENQNVMDFVAEYLGETDMSLNTLWVNLRKNSYGQEWTTWKDRIVAESIFECPYHTPSNLCPNCTESRSCGAVVRMFHSEICFVKLQCDARRKFICRRSIMEMSKSTHLDWIKIGNKLFKIFYERLTYDRASEACTLYDIKSKLALIETYTEAFQLGRFLLIGRPSKERVWIGARWEYDGYAFEEESAVLSNVTDSSGYPPWLRGEISKPFGCLLLDRHLDNLTYFVESSCQRHHSYMCYKHYEPPPFVESCFIGNYDWRIYYTPQTWFQALETCRKSHPTGRLPYIESQDLKTIIHVMETSKFDVLYHVWLGAYFDNGIWTWTYNNIQFLQKSIDGFPPWVVNKTHEPNIEKYNLCLNLDREDSLEAIFYGTHCYYPQFFICQYDKDSICRNMTTTTSTTERPLTTAFTTKSSTRTTKHTTPTTPVSTITPSTEYTIQTTTASIIKPITEYTTQTTVVSTITPSTEYTTQTTVVSTITPSTEYTIQTTVAPTVFFPITEHTNVIFTTVNINTDSECIVSAWPGPRGLIHSNVQPDTTTESDNINKLSEKKRRKNDKKLQT